MRELISCEIAGHTYRQLPYKNNLKTKAFRDKY